MEEEIKILREKGKTWKEVAKILKVSVSTAQKHFKQIPAYPKTHEAYIHRKVVNPRMILVRIGEEVVPAVIRPGRNYRQGVKVNVQQVDATRYRVV